MKQLLLAAFLAISLADLSAAGPPPKFHEVFDLVRTNLGGVAPVEIERTALEQFLRLMDGKVLLEDSKPPTPVAPTGPALGKSAVFDEIYGYLRVNHVGPKLDEMLLAEFANLGGARKLRGLILDLRYAGGADQKVAARVADAFIASERVLLSVEGEAQSSTAKTNAILLPTAVVVNHHTSGAAEVLAALLRQNQVGLLIGTATTGGVRQFKDFTLSTGQRLRIATGETKLGDGHAMPAAGLRPDIAVSVGPEEERAFYAEPFRRLGQASVGSSAAGKGKDAPTRLNEAELLRRMREGQNPDGAPPVVSSPSAATPQVRDPALARALDLLKGLAVVRELRKP